MAAIVYEANQKRDREEAIQKYLKVYINRRNDIMFVFKFVSPYVPSFHAIKANHGIAMFIVSKKAYLDMRDFFKNLIERKNIFGFSKYF